MKKLFLILSFTGCTTVKDYSFLNTDRRPYVRIESKRFTEKWVWYKTVLYNMSPDIDTTAYSGLKPDTLISSCSIDKIDSNFRVEIRSYLIIKF